MRVGFGARVWEWSTSLGSEHSEAIAVGNAVEVIGVVEAHAVAAVWPEGNAGDSSRCERVPRRFVGFRTFEVAEEVVGSGFIYHKYDRLAAEPRGESLQSATPLLRCVRDNVERLIGVAFVDLLRSAAAAWKVDAHHRGYIFLGERSGRQSRLNATLELQGVISVMVAVQHHKHGERSLCRGITWAGRILKLGFALPGVAFSSEDSHSRA